MRSAIWYVFGQRCLVQVVQVVQVCCTTSHARHPGAKTVSNAAKSQGPAKAANVVLAGADIFAKFSIYSELPLARHPV